MSKPRDIRITLITGAEEHTFLAYPWEYRNLMALIYDHLYIEGFGECKGVGRCGTCHVKVKNRPGLHTRVGNEATTLTRISGVTDESRLACQILITPGIHDIRVELPSEE